MRMETLPYNSFEVIQSLVKKKVCAPSVDIVKHSKMIPECRNITRQNCITKWETDEEGKQVWAGNESCEPVTLEKCELVPNKVSFQTPNVTCVDKGDVPYYDYTGVKKNKMMSRMSCEVKHTTSCEEKVSNKCEVVKVQVKLNC